MKIKALFLVILLSLLFHAEGIFPKNNITQIELILDASRSMRQKIKGVQKIKIAKDALIKLLNEFKTGKNIHIGLRIFGHKNKRCNNTILEVPISKDGFEKITKKIKNIIPMGNTPIAYSLLKATSDFKKELPGKKVVIIITDGNENCKDDPCKVAGKLKKEGIVSKVHIVAFGFKKQSYLPLKCIVKPSGGVVVRADDLKELVKGLRDIIAIDTSVRIEKDKPLKNNLTITGKGVSGNKLRISVEVYRDDKFVKSDKGEIVSFYLDEGKYSLRIIAVQTKQEIEVDNVRIYKDKLTEKNVKFTRVLLLLNVIDKNKNLIDSEIIVYRAGTKKVVARRKRVELITDNLVLTPGIYDIKITDLATSSEKFIKGLNINSYVTERKISFKRGIFRINGKNRSNRDKTVAVTVYESGTENVIIKLGGAKVHKLTLLPGTYDIKVNDWYGTGEKWLLKQKIIDGMNVSKNVIVPDK